MPRTNTDDWRSHSHLFVLRIWLEDLGEGKTEWRGKVECVACGEVRYFRDWGTLVTLVRSMLPHSHPDRENVSQLT